MIAYKYTIHLQILFPGQTVEINEENIISLAIDYDYHSEVVMPIVIIKVRFDKNLIDKLIQNKDKSKIILRVNKVLVTQSNQVEQPYINTVCTYELMDDTYADKTNMYNKNSTMKDIYAETIIGLISEDCINRNIRNNDCVIKNGNMAGAVAYFTNHKPILIEPFTYNKSFEQLIVPPMESIKQIIKFLANIAVFYDSPIRYFNDFHKVYLLSSKGNPVEMIGEQASRVVISLRKGDTADEPFEQGIIFNTSKNWYDLPISTNDAVYNVNNIIEKDFNKLIGIIDPSRKQSIPTIIGDAISNIVGDISNLNNCITSNRDLIAAGANNAIQGNNEVGYEVGVINHATDLYIAASERARATCDTLLDKYYETLNKLKEKLDKLENENSSSGNNSKKSSIYDDEDDDDDESEKYTAWYNSGKAELPVFEQVSTDALSYMRDATRCKVNMTGISNIATKSAYSTTSYESLYNGIKIENLPNNLATLEGKTPINEQYSELIQQRAAASTNYLGSFKTAMNTSLTNTLDSLLEIRTIIDDMYEEIKKLAEEVSENDSGSTGGSVKYPITEAEHNLDLYSIDYEVGVINTQYDTMKNSSNTINEWVTSNSSFSQVMDNTINKAAGLVADLGKNMLTNLVGGLFSGQGLNGLLDELGTGAIWDVFTTNINNIIESTYQSGLAELGIGSLAEFNNLDNILNLSGAGKVGLTSLISNRLKILDSGGLDRIKYIDLGNDDPNKIKVVENEIALSGTSLSITKDNIDNSVITLNKEYLVQNVDMKTELNGRYLLRHKQEIYVREDNLFNAKTILDFVKCVV